MSVCAASARRPQVFNRVGLPSAASRLEGGRARVLQPAGYPRTPRHVSALANSPRGIPIRPTGLPRPTATSRARRLLDQSASSHQGLTVYHRPRRRPAAPVAIAAQRRVGSSSIPGLVDTRPKMPNATETASMPIAGALRR